LEILRPLNETRLLVETITYLGYVMEVTGNYSKAIELFSEGLEKATVVGDRWFAALCISLQVNVAMMIGNYENAYERLHSVVADWRAIGDPRFTALGLNLLNQSALLLGKYDEALAALEESAVLSNSVGDRWELGFTYRGLSAVAQKQGDYQQSVLMLRKSLDIFTELGGRLFVAQGLSDMGHSNFALGNDTEAEHNWRESLRIATETHGIPVALEAITGFAHLIAKRGDAHYAIELLTMVLNHHASFKNTKDRAEQLRLDLIAHLTKSQVEEVQARAEAKSFETMVEEIMKQAY
jgi:tetratricopeptide (TPR) repeat protein